MIKRIFITFTLGLLLTIVTQAQEDDPLNSAEVCGDNLRQTYIDVFTSLLETLNDEANDVQDAVVLAQTAIASVRVLCDSYVFTSEEYGMSSVTDPIIIKDGIYRMILESEENFSVDITEVDGDCGTTFEYVPSQGGRVESVSEMEDCVAIFDFDAGAEWTLTYEPIIINEEE